MREGVGREGGGWTYDLYEIVLDVRNLNEIMGSGRMKWT